MGVMQSIDVIANVGVSDVHDVLCSKAGLGRVERIEQGDASFCVADVRRGAIMGNEDHARPVFFNGRVGEGGEIVRFGHVGQWAIDLDGV
jgi:hypothetical protein